MRLWNPMLNTKSPKVSVVIPTYNRKNFLTRSIDSVLNQSYENWELIIVDDGSTDDSYDLVERLYSADERIKLVKIQNSGAAIAMNTGAEFATGKYLFFLGSDDCYLPNHLEFRVNYHMQHPDLDIVYGGVKVVGDHWVVDKNNSNTMVNIYECHAGGTFSLKLKVFNQLKGFKDVSYSSDSDLIERAEKEHSLKKIHFPVTYLYFRDHKHSITKDLQQ